MRCEMTRRAWWRRVRLKFEPRDMWVGTYVDPENQRIYVCVVPCLVVVYEGAR